MKKPKNVAASVKQRLLNLARANGEDFNLILTRYGNERLLYRLCRSDHGDDFVLKGAMLFALWTGKTHRPTRDLDLLGKGRPDLDRIAELFREVCRVVLDDDGLVFDPDSVEPERIRDDAEYEGVRVRINGHLGSAKVRLQVDVGIGDAVVPPPEVVEYPVLLDHAPPRLRAYRRETVIAEKLQAMVELGMANSRMKDFFDVRYLAMNFEFDGGELVRAIEATFDRRRTPIPTGAPTALTDTFAKDSGKQTQWSAFLRRTGLEGDVDLEEVIADLRRFLLPPLDALSASRPFVGTWPTPGPWAT